jgi:ABC-type glycerol-3-phosphate transport system substrate-binding protein
MNKFYKNKIFRTISLLSISLILTGCTLFGNQPSENDPDDPGQEETIVLTWWNLFEPQQNVQFLIDKFEAENPNIKIQYELKAADGNIGAYRNELNSLLENQDEQSILRLPDIFTIHNSWIGAYQSNLSVAPSDIITNEITADYYDIVKNDLIINNQVIGLPMSLDTIAIIYNKKLLINSGYTIPSDDWSEFQLQATNMTKKSDSGQIVTAGFSAYSPNNTEFYFEVVNLLMMQNQAQLFNSDSKINLTNNIDVESAFQFYRSFISGNTQTWSTTMKLDIVAFLEGNLAMYAAPSWRLIDILNYNQRYNLGLDIGVEPIPQPGGDDNIQWPSYWPLVVSKSSINANASWKFIKFLSENENLIAFDNKVKENGRPIGIIFPKQTLASDKLQDRYLGAYTRSIPNTRNWNMYDGFLIKQSFDKYFREDQSRIDLSGLEQEINNIIKI